MEKILTVKVIPSDGVWQSALPLIKAIEETPDLEKLADKLHIEVADVFSDNRAQRINAGCVYNSGNIQNASPIVRMF